MTLKNIRYLSVLLLAILSSIAYSAPMGFKNSWMITGDIGKSYQDAGINYALTTTDAIGFETSHIESKDDLRRQNNTEMVYTRRLARWNMPEAQANIWFIGGIGSSTSNAFDGTKTTLSPGIQVDYETTRFYSMAAVRTYTAPGITSHMRTVRVGASFYEASYDEAQPWFIVEARQMTFASKQYEITPMLRFIHNRYFIEAGASLSGGLRFNFLYNY